MITANETPTKAQAVESAYDSPNVAIHEEQDAYILLADLPGVAKQGLDITLEGNNLTITGSRAQNAVNATLLYRESRPFSLRRTFELSPTIDGSRAEAKIEQGVLTLRLPKLEKIKPRKIVVTE